MKRIFSISAAAALVAAIAVAAIGAGGSNASASASRTSVDLRSTKLGKTLVDQRGRTLYLFEADRPNVSNCRGACLTYWPAFTSKTPRAGHGVSAARLGTIAGPGGKRQLTYGKHPLYFFIGDKKPGDTNGEGLNQFGAKWYALSASGRKIDRD
jgi:predicted lipoprotein with Yx(FWY)xxD motif